MIKNILFLCLFSVTFSNIIQAQAIKKRVTKESVEQTVITSFSGDLAYETTAFVEQYWRVVGNTGFNESIFFIAKHLENAFKTRSENVDFLVPPKTGKLMPREGG